MKNFAFILQSIEKNQLPFSLLLAILLFLPMNGFSQNGNSGTDFWFSFPRIFNGNSSKSVQINSVQGASGNVTNPITGWSQAFNVPPNGKVVISIPVTEVETVNSQVIENKAINVTSNNPINVLAVTREAVRVESSMILPADVLGTEYAVFSYPALGTNKSNLVVVGTQNSTNVAIRLSDNAAGGGGPGTTLNVTLNRGQVYQVEGAQFNSDLTGTLVTSNKPVAVFGGSGDTYVPTSCQFADPLYEQMPPRNDCGKNYFTVPYPNHSQYLVRVVAFENGTSVTIDGATTNLAQGQFLEQNVSNTVHCIQANRDIGVVQFSTGDDCNGIPGGDPSMMFVTPIELGTKSAFVSSFYLNSILQDPRLIIVTQTSNTGNMTLNGNQINGFATTNCSGYSFATVAIGNNLANINSTGSKFTAYISSMSNGSEGYSSGLVYAADCCVNAGLVFSAPEATEGCQSATVTISFPAPVSTNTTVNLNIGGTAINGTDYQSIPGSIVIPAGQSSSTFTINPITDNFIEGTETVTFQIQTTANCGPDTYSFNIKDALQAPSLTCSSTANSVIVSWSSITGATNYQVNVNNTGWVAANGNLQHTIAGTPGQSFTIEVRGTSSSSCFGPTSSITCSIPITCNITLTVNQVSGVDCAGTNTGSANVVVNGGNPPFTYLWDNGETASTAISLGVGVHTVTITDAAGCTNAGSVQISGPNALTISLNSSSSGCDALCNKSADITVSGGTPPYGYLWSSNESTEDATGLCPGINTVSVLDNNGCIQSLTITINSTAFSAAINQNVGIQCNGGCNGVLSVSTTGGVAPYQYNWSNGATGQVVNDLCNGSYTVSIIDANGCVIVDTQTITEPTKIAVLADIDDASCNTSNGEIGVTATGGQPGYTFLWDNNATTPTISGLNMGTYTVTVTDDNNCCSVLSLILGMDDCCTNTSNPCVDAIQGTIDICTEINADPSIPLSTIDCDGDGVTNGDECSDNTDPLDPCDYVDTSISLPVIADQSGCPQPCPDLSPITTVLPGNVAGSSPIEVAVAVSEVDGVDTDGTIISLRIPSDPRLLFVWSISLTQAAGVPVQNSDWNYLGDNGVFHNWTYNGNGQVINGNAKSAIGFQAFYDPQGTDGQTTITATIVPFSGGDCNILNNSDSERLVYFK